MKIIDKSEIPESNNDLVNEVKKLPDDKALLFVFLDKKEAKRKRTSLQQLCRLSRNTPPVTTRIYKTDKGYQLYVWKKENKNQA